MKWVPGSEIEVFRSDAHGPSGNAFDAQGRLYTCETRARRLTRTDKNGRIEVLAEQWEGKRLNAPNHVAVSRNDHVYFTDPAFGSQSDHRELDFYGVYHLPPKGPLKLVAKGAGRPNGIALSPNGRTLYVGNSDEHNVRAYDIDRNGDASGERVLISGIKAVPVGVSTDDKGNLYVAAGGIAIYSPEGRFLHMIEMHDPPSACALGEADFKSLLVTARGSVFRARLDAGQ
jgi:gluconolactonase